MDAKTPGVDEAEEIPGVEDAEETPGVDDKNTEDNNESDKVEVKKKKHRMYV